MRFVLGHFTAEQLQNGLVPFYEASIDTFLKIIKTTKNRRNIKLHTTYLPDGACHITAKSVTDLLATMQADFREVFGLRVEFSIPASKIISMMIEEEDLPEYETEEQFFRILSIDIEDYLLYSENYLCHMLISSIDYRNMLLESKALLPPDHPKAASYDAMLQNNIETIIQLFKYLHDTTLTQANNLLRPDVPDSNNQLFNSLHNARIALDRLTQQRAQVTAGTLSAAINKADLYPPKFQSRKKAGDRNVMFAFLGAVPPRSMLFSYELVARNPTLVQRFIFKDGDKRAAHLIAANLFGFEPALPPRLTR